jgi:predicted CxxxxCH...CXXCH cytochrome family protein
MHEGKRRGGVGVLCEPCTEGRIRLPVIISLALVFAVVLTTAGVNRTDAKDCDCTFCHGGTGPHGEGWQGCSSCHDSPPQTGSHLTHYGSAPVIIMRYGDTSTSGDTDNYKFGCGNCHPLDNAKHRNGIVDVELYNPLAPEGSIKAKNPATAAFTPGTYVSYSKGSYTFSYSNGTCTDIYCHSGYTVTAGPVGLPLTYPPDPIPEGFLLNFGYIMDETCSSLTYAPYTASYQRVFKTTPTWGTSGTFTTCTECHEFPLTTYYPDVNAGVGDSHQWVDERGWNWRHAYAMGGNPIQCRSCHNGTVSQDAPVYWDTPQGYWIYVFDPIPLSNKTNHVNGSADVIFDTVNAWTYWGTGSYSLLGAAYDPATKTCSDVSCHYNGSNLWQKKVRWGAPDRMDEGVSGAECDLCHRYGYLDNTCTTP